MIAISRLNFLSAKRCIRQVHGATTEVLPLKDARPAPPLGPDTFSCWDRIGAGGQSRSPRQRSGGYTRISSSPLPTRWSYRQVALTLGFAAVLVAVLLGIGDGARLVSALGGLWTRPDYLAIFLLTYTAAFCLRAVAWRLLLPGGPGVARMFAILQVALLANHLFPTKVGEVVRAGLLAQRGVPVGAAAGSTLLARLLDFAVVCLIALAAMPLTGGRVDAQAGLLGLPMAVLLIAIFSFYAVARGRPLPLASRLPVRIARAVDEARASLASVSRGRLLAALAVVVPSWLLEAGALWSVAQVADVPLALALAIGSTAFTVAFQGFQFTPGGLGLYEASLTGVLVVNGVDPAAALTLAVATHALKFAYSYLVGLPCFVAVGISGLVSGAKWASSSTPPLADPPKAVVGQGHGGAGAHLPVPARADLDARAWTGVGSVRDADSVRNDPTPRVGPAAFTLPAFPVSNAGPLSRLNLSTQPASGLVLAALFYTACQPYAWASHNFWLGLASGSLATVPLAVLGRCHHLPGKLSLSLLAVPLVFFSLFGLPAPPLGLVALALAGVLALSSGQKDLAVISWPLLLTQSIAAGAREPLGVALFGLAALVVVLLVRQWWLARHPLSPPGPPPSPGVLAVIVPVHDEAASIAGVVAGVPRSSGEELGFNTQVIVVDDGSTDGSGRIARAAGADLVIRHPRRLGLGAAVRTGLGAARRIGAGAAVYLDGDGEYDPSAIPKVAGPILRGEADYVLGTRLPYAAPAMRPSRRLGNQLFTILVSLLSGHRLLDSQTGFRAFSARALANAEIIHDYNYAQVLTLDLVRKRMRLAQVPISYRARQHGRSFIRYHEYLCRVLPAISREVLAP